MLQEQRGDFVEIDHFSHGSPPYRRIEGIRHAVGREGISAAEPIGNGMNIERIRAQLAKIFGVDGETQWQQEKKKEDHPHGKPPGSGGSEAGERRVAGRRLPHPPFTSAQSLLLIILDNLRRANFRFVRVKPDVA